MKLIPILLFVIALSKGCKEETADLNQATITYSAHSRGFYRDVLIKDKNVTVTGAKGKEVYTDKIEDADWKAMRTAFADITPEDLQNLKAPTNQRFYDGAAIAKLIVEYKGKTYESIDFDHGTPPAEISRFVNLLAVYVTRDE